VIHDGTMVWTIQTEGPGGPKVVKWPISKSFILSTGTHVIKRLMVNYDNPRQYVNF